MGSVCRVLLLSILFIIVILVCIYFRDLVLTPIFLYYSAAVFSGTAAGLLELLQMFSIAATRNLWKILWSWAFVLTNVFAGVVAALLKGFEVTDRTGAIGSGLLMGLTGIVVLRGSITTVKVGQDNVAVGPALILDQIKSQLEIRLDSVAGAELFARVAKMMKSFDVRNGRDKLVLICLAMRERLSDDAQKKLYADIAKLEEEDGAVVATLIGLVLVRAAGEDALKAALLEFKDEFIWKEKEDLDNLRSVIYNIKVSDGKGV